MEGEIINKVANSSLVTVNLEDFYQKEERIVFDITPYLWQGLVVKEKDFRAALKETDWSKYQNKLVAIFCSEDAIIPSWAYMLIALELSFYAKKTVLGSLEDLERELFIEALSKLDYSIYKDQRVIVKGCSAYPVPEMAYLHLVQLLKPYTKSIMFGEACSTVPLYKKK
jgi:hypothetical protein